MNASTRLPWIQHGYTLFAETGPAGFKVDVLAKRVSKSKSSFYHLFGDVDGHIDALLDYHLERTTDIAALARQCEQMDPDILQLMADMKEDVFFHRQLRIHRQHASYKVCFENAFDHIADAFYTPWSRAVGLDQNAFLAQLILKLVADNFFLRITNDTYDYLWLRTYLSEIRATLSQIRI